MQTKLTFISLLLPLCIVAQIPLRHHLPPVHGPIQESEAKYYKKVELDVKGRPILPEFFRDKTHITYQNGNATSAHYWAYLKGDDLAQETKFSYIYNREGKPTLIKKYNSNRWEKDSPLRLDYTSTARYRNGHLRNESLIKHDGTILSSYEYWEENDKNGIPFQKFQRFYYSDGKLNEGNIYGLQYQNELKTIHFSLNKKGDTTYFSRDERIGPRTIKTIGFRRQSAKKITFIYFSKTLERDTFGNPTLEIQWNGKKASEKKTYLCTTTRYRYQGEPAWETPKKAMHIEVLGEWVSMNKNIEIEFGKSPTGFPGGIFSAKPYREAAEQEIMDDGDSWIDALAQSRIGEWVWDAEKRHIRFEQNKHILVEIQAEIVRDVLILRPLKEWANELKLERK